jgi:hypothetical protein
MAEVFKNAKVVNISDSVYDVAYTCPANKTAIIISAQVANTIGSLARVSAQWVDSSDSAAAVPLTQDVAVPSDTAINIIAARLVLEEGDTLEFKSDTVAALSVSVSLLEITQ